MPQQHDFAATLQFGIVVGVDEAGHNLRVRLPALEDMETDWLPMATPASGGNQFYSLPDEGEQVVCLLDARGENGAVIGTIYSSADTPPAASKDMWVRRFANGTVISHDRSSGTMAVDTPGEVQIVAAAKVTMQTPVTDITGAVNVFGHLTYSSGLSASSGSGDAAQIKGTAKVDGDIVLNGISLKDFVANHTHPDTTSGGNTGTPNSL